MRHNQELPEWVYDVIDDVCVGNGINSIALYDPAPRLPKHLAHIRNIVVYIVRAIGGSQPSFPELGRAFGKHHTTLVAGDRTIRAQLKGDSVASRILNKRITTYINNHIERQGELTCHIGEVLDLTRDTSQPIN